MNFNKHTNLEGQHALIGASSYHWINYSDEKFQIYYEKKKAVERGTKLHEIAKQLIEQKIRMERKQITLNMYVNDAIGYDMKPEQILYYSAYAFGTADAISFSSKDGLLRIHDLKTGITPASMHQLEIYAALFCLEYDVRPSEIQIETRIYQNDDIMISEPTIEIVAPIMEKIKTFSKLAKAMDEED